MNRRKLLSLTSSLVLALLCAACSGGSGAGPNPNPGPGPNPNPNPNPNPASPTLELSLQLGDYWHYYWRYDYSRFVQGSGGSGSSDTGDFQVTVVGQQVIQGLDAFRLEVTGDAENSDRNYTPRWQFLAVDGSRMMGSTDGVTLEPIFDISDNTWHNGGFLLDFGDADVKAGTGRIENEFIEVDGHRASVSDGGGGGVYFSIPGVGTIHSGDPEWSISQAEYYKDGIGAIGLSEHRGWSSNGGNFFTSFSHDHEVGLVYCSLTAKDGWRTAPRLWNFATSMTEPRTNFGAAAHSGTVYVFGGEGTAPASGPANVLGSVEAYDPATDTWSPRTSMPTPRGGCTATEFDGRIYVIGGHYYNTGGSQERSRAVEVYDPIANSWTQLADFPQMNGSTMRPSGSGVVANTQLPGGRGIAMAGYFGSDDTYVFYFNPVTGLWYYGTDTDQPRDREGGVVSDGTDLLVIGGSSRHLLIGSIGWQTLYSSQVYRWVTATDQWSQESTLNVGCSNPAVTLLDGTIYTIGGANKDGLLRRVESFGLGGTTWEARGDLLKARSAASAIAVGGKVYAIGGSAADGVTATVEVFDPNAP